MNIQLFKLRRIIFNVRQKKQIMAFSCYHVKLVSNYLEKLNSSKWAANGEMTDIFISKKKKKKGSIFQHRK